MQSLALTICLIVLQTLNINLDFLQPDVPLSRTSNDFRVAKEKKPILKKAPSVPNLKNLATCIFQRKKEKYRCYIRWLGKKIWEKIRHCNPSLASLITHFHNDMFPWIQVLTSHTAGLICIRALIVLGTEE